MGASVKRAVKRFFAMLGYEMQKLSVDSDTMSGAMLRLAPRFEITSVVDIGASNGSWTEKAQRSFPGAEYLLIEAQGQAHGDALEQFARSRDRVQYIIAAAGDEEGEVHFDATDPFGGVASRNSTGSHDIMVPMTTVDGEVTRRGLQGPFFLKLDTHGFEVPIFEGAARTLEDTQLLVVEAYNFEIQPGSLRFHELCSYLEERGFRCIDLVDILHRPGDHVLWQADLFFARADRAEFVRTTYVEPRPAP